MADLRKTVVNSVKSVMRNQGEEVQKNTPDPAVAALAQKVSEDLALDEPDKCGHKALDDLFSKELVKREIRFLKLLLLWL